MCPFNPACYSSDGSCDCWKSIPNSKRTQPLPPYPVYPSLELSFLSSVFIIIQQQNILIQTLTNSLENIQQRLLELSEAQDLKTNNFFQKIKNPDLSEYTHKLKLVNDLPSPAYKGRLFNAVLQVVDKNDRVSVLSKKFNFRILLFAPENPPKNLTTNISGECVFKGKIEVKGNSLIEFLKISVNEVSSKFVKGHFLLVVKSEEAGFVEPFVLDRFIVKSRKCNDGEGLKKIRKIQEEES